MVREVQSGRRAAADELLPLVYQQLRAVAQQQMGGERPDHTLQATALVHEAYARLVGNDELEWAGRGHFYAAAAEAMRRILVEHARARARVKRGGPGIDGRRVPLSVVSLAEDQNPQEILTLDETFRRLEERAPEMADVVRLRFYAGLSGEQTALALGVSPATVKRRWTWARSWLYREMKRQAGEEKQGVTDDA
jgi:RNA polymerase sigma factor (TIGR02999 family)